MGTATTLAEAQLLEKNGIDIVIAQGSEAGGHRGTFLTNAEDALTKISTLTPLLIKELKIPVITAGGIMDAKGIAAALEQGASGVQMGTAFLCCTESKVPSAYKEILLNSHKGDSTLTRAFSGKLARGIKNKFIERMLTHENDILEYPIQNALTQPMRKTAQKLNLPEFMSLFAGESAYLCKEISAAALIKELTDELNKM